MVAVGARNNNLASYPFPRGEGFSRVITASKDARGNAVTREGGHVRKIWILSSICLVCSVGCAGTGMLAGGSQLVAQPQAEQTAAPLNGAPQTPKPSWTKKVTNVFAGNGANQPSPAKAQTSSELDPISLGFASGPPNAQLYLSMAKMSDQGGNTPHARSMYQRALSIEPKNLEGMLALARLEDREGQLDAALHYYQQAVHLHPQSAKALNDLSLCFARRGQLNEALPPLEQAIRLDASKQLYRNNIAKVLIERNDINGALQHLAAVHPPAVAQYNLGVLLHQRGRDGEAVQFLAAAKRTDPTMAAADSLLTELMGVSQQAAQPQVAQSRTTQPNDHILPTPRTAPGQVYPSTGAVSVSPPFKTVPAETARVPVGYTPSSLPPVR